MTKAIGVLAMFALLVPACSAAEGPGESAAASPSASTTTAAPSATPAQSPSPTATTDDFRGDWCGAVLPYSRLLENELPTLSRDARVVRAVRKTVQQLDALRIDLEGVDLHAAAAAVGDLADAIDAHADALDASPFSISAGGLTDYLRTQTRSMRRVNQTLTPAVNEMGRC